MVRVSHAKNGGSRTDLNRTCPVCGANHYQEYFRPPRSPGPIVKCKECGFVFVNPVKATKSLIQKGPVGGRQAPHLLESSNLEDIAGSWEQPLLEGYKAEFSAKRLNALDALQHISKYAKSRGTLLDVGCGAGLFLSVAAQEGWDCYGIEPLVMHAIFARAQFGLHIVTDTLSEDTYPAEFFDVVTAFQVFEHLIRPDQELDKIRRILKPQGLVLIEVPNIETLGVKLFGTRHRHFVQDHVSFFSAKTLTSFVERHDLRVQEIYYPTRVMSVRHLAAWLGRSTQSGKRRRIHLPQAVREKFIRLNLGDIVAVIAKKN